MDIDQSFLDEDVTVMAKIEDRHRAFVVDGRPVVTGVAAVAVTLTASKPERSAQTT